MSSKYSAGDGIVDKKCNPICSKDKINSEITSSVREKKPMIGRQESDNKHHTPYNWRYDPELLFSEDFEQFDDCGMHLGYSPNSSNKYDMAMTDVGGYIPRPCVDVKSAKPAAEGATIPAYSQVIHPPAPPPDDHINQQN